VAAGSTDRNNPDGDWGEELFFKIDPLQVPGTRGTVEAKAKVDQTGSGKPAKKVSGRGTSPWSLKARPRRGGNAASPGHTALASLTSLDPGRAPVVRLGEV
jgi:hypothetical protein